ncbi:MAG TPA: hypothetical protein VL463_14950 [Kofleriaceae bacterium]|nr:hypothetical protein [Kofleriaceae bacterium]
MTPRIRAAAFAITTIAAAATARAGNVSGKLDLPPSGAPPLRDPGFLDRVENPHMPVKTIDPTPLMVVVLEPAAPPSEGASPSQVTWDLLGASFAKPLLPVVAGTEVTIANCRACRPASLFVDGAPDAIAKGVLNPKGTKQLKTSKPGVLVVKDDELPSLIGRVAVFSSPYFAQPDPSGKFEIKDVPNGSYTVKVWYLDHFVERGNETINVEGKHSAEVPTVRVPTGFPGPGGAGGK